MYNQLPRQRKDRIVARYNLILKKEYDNADINYAAVLQNKTEPTKTICIAKFMFKINKIKMVIENVETNTIFNKKYKEYLFKLFIELLQKKIKSIESPPILIIKIKDPSLVEVLIETCFIVDVIQNIKEVLYVGAWEYKV